MVHALPAEGNNGLANSLIGHARSSSPTLDAALELLRAGFSILPICRDGSKSPALNEWKGLQVEPMSEGEARRLWGASAPPGIGILGGAVSGNKEAIDFDRDAEIYFPRWRELVEAEASGLLDRLTVVRSPRPGFHVHYRVTGSPVPGNLVLARLTKEEEPDAKKRTLLETRGEGGYILAPGSPEECHESRRTYEHYSGPALTLLPTITADERGILIRCARAFDREVREDARPAPSQTADLRPGDLFDLQGWDWAELLTQQGWTCSVEKLVSVL